MTSSALEDTVRGQCLRLARVAQERARSIAYAKPHGALYHDANASAEAADAVVVGLADALGPHVTLIGPPGGALAAAAAKRGIAYAREGFADRAARPDGTLVPRGEPGALVTDPAAAAAQAERLASSGSFETLCVHGDTPGAAAIARAVRRVLDSVAGA
jgi:UPF0271 protein